MDKAKYEKPLLVELGFDSEVMGTRCKNGPSNLSQCKTGPTAKSCSGGSSNLVDICVTGAVAGS